MSFWKRRKQASQQAPSPGDAGQVQKTKRTVKRSPPVAMEVKVLALEALDAGLSATEVGELVGVGSGTIHKWRQDYAAAGVQGLCRKASSIAIRKQCSVLEEKIVALRREHPEHGVRRIRDDLMSLRLILICRGDQLGLGDIGVHVGVHLTHKARSDESDFYHSCTSLQLGVNAFCSIGDSSRIVLIYVKSRSESNPFRFFRDIFSKNGYL